MVKAQRRRGPILFSAALKSFIGHLQGSGKAEHTIASYHFDLLSFAEFMQKSRGSKQVLDLKSVSRKDLDRFHEWLKSDGQKTNTRRRKLMTVRKLMHYLTARKKLDLDIASRLPAPEKIERVPETIDLEAYRKKLETLPTGSYIAIRNVALLALLSDTGCSVSEASKLRWSAIDGKVSFMGKSERDCALSPRTLAWLSKLRAEALSLSGATDQDSIADEVCFVGFNRHGPIRIGKKTLGITSRGIEMLVKSVSETLGFADVTPRTLRHSAVVDWYRSGVREVEIQRRLGLRTAYAFRIYQPIFSAMATA